MVRNRQKGKTLKQLSKMFNISYQLLYRTISKNGITPTEDSGVNYYSEYDVEVIERCLYFERKISEIILPSGMNERYDGDGSLNNYINRTNHFVSENNNKNSNI